MDENFITEIEKQKLFHGGRCFGKEYFSEEFPKNDFPFDKSLYKFLQEWFSCSETIELMTSGSTGQPKKITALKKHMINSAAATCRILRLSNNDRAFLCMDMKYIGAMMMVVRALTASMDLSWVRVSGNPFKSISHNPTFAALTTIQLYNTLHDETEKARLFSVNKVIIGGGRINEFCKKELLNFPGEVYSTYGMTETLSHVALMDLKNTEYKYKPLPGIKLTLRENSLLDIFAPEISDEIIHTNDMVDLDENGNFTFEGRADDMINSGGIKFQICKIEEYLEPMIDTDFAVTSVPDEKFGEVITIVADEKFNMEKYLGAQARHSDSRQDSERNYMKPKKLIMVPEIPKTGNGKTNRAECKKLYLKYPVVSLK